MIVTPLSVTIDLARDRPATLPPCAAAMSTITLPGFMRATISAVSSLRRRPARDQRGGDDDVDVGGLLGVDLGARAGCSPRDVAFA